MLQCSQYQIVGTVGKLADFFTTGAAAAKIGVAAGTIREYERLGLLRAARDSAGRRIFTAADINRGTEIATQRAARRLSGLKRDRAAT